MVQILVSVGPPDPLLLETDQEVIANVGRDVKVFKMERNKNELSTTASGSLDPNSEDDPPSIETFGYTWESIGVSGLKVGQTIYIYYDLTIENDGQHEIKEIHIYNFDY